MLIEIVNRVPPSPPRKPPVTLRAVYADTGISAEVEFSISADDRMYGHVLAVRYMPPGGSVQQTWHFACNPDAIPSVVVLEVYLWLVEFVAEAKKRAREHFAGV